MNCAPPLITGVNKDVFTAPPKTGIRLTLMLDLAVALIVQNLDKTIPKTIFRFLDCSDPSSATLYFIRLLDLQNHP